MKTFFYSFIMFSSLFLAVCHKKMPIEPGPIYTPLRLDDWDVSTPEQESVDVGVLEQAYREADRLSNIYSLLVIKNGYLIGERYFNGENCWDDNSVASVGKSIVSVLTGIALHENILTDIDQELAYFFPEIDWQSIDPRKSQITIRQILQMRSGYPWEEFSGHIDFLFSRGNYIPLLVTFPLASDPGTEFGYSNFTAHLMGIILARTANVSLMSYAQGKLFDPLGATIAYWSTDSLGYHWGSGCVSLTPRDLAKFGQMVLDDGKNDDVQIVPSDWIEESLKTYSFNTYGRNILTHLRQLDYGYLWWSAKAGDYQVKFAWGHGGQLVALVHELNMVIVTTADDLAGQFGTAAWQKEKAVMELVGKFISRL